MLTFGDTVTQVLGLQRTSWVPLVSIWQLNPFCSSSIVSGVKSWMQGSPPVITT
jgi:hypothetical protein